MQENCQTPAFQINDIIKKKLLLKKDNITTLYTVLSKHPYHDQAVLKEINKQFDESEDKYPKQEIELQKNLNHKNICKFLDYTISNSKFEILLEFCSGGNMMNLFPKIKDQNQFTAFKPLGKNLCILGMRQIIDGFQYIQQKIPGFVHRDIKLENILYDDQGGEIIFKICDFGISKIITKNKTVPTYVGTPYSMAPEVLQLNDESWNKEQKEKYYEITQQIDMWSLGVVFYLMWTGKLPYDMKYSDSAFQNQKKIDFNGLDASQLPSVIQEILQKMLEKNNKKRLNFKQLFQISNNLYIKQNQKKIVYRSFLISNTQQNALDFFQLLKQKVQDSNLSDNQQFGQIVYKNYEQKEIELNIQFIDYDTFQQYNNPEHSTKQAQRKKDMIIILITSDMNAGLDKILDFWKNQFKQFSVKNNVNLHIIFEQGKQQNQYQQIEEQKQTDNESQLQKIKGFQKELAEIFDIPALLTNLQVIELKQINQAFDIFLNKIQTLQYYTESFVECTDNIQIKKQEDIVLLNSKKWFNCC